MNENQLAKAVTLIEGKKINLKLMPIREKLRLLIKMFF